jgi:putative SOS response-associated peptidase YedK
MNSFVGQDGSIRFHYRTYGVDEVAPFSPQPRIRPNARIFLLVQGKERVEQHRGNWGMGTGRFDWNARDDRLDESPLWKHMWGKREGHCVIPVSRVYEATTRHGQRQWHAIRRADEEPLLIPGLGRVQAGKYRTEWHVSMVTVDAGPVFQEVHDRPREVVCLRTWSEATTWMAGADKAAMRALLRPAEEGLVQSYRVHDDVLKEAFPAEKCAAPWDGSMASAPTP